MRRRILKITGWTALAAVLFAVSLAAAFYMHFYREAPAPAYPKATGPLVAQQQDLDYFGKLMARDRAFTPQTRAEADRRLAQLKASTVVLDHEHLRVALMQIMALADNGHSRLGYDPEAAPRQLPVRVALFPDGVYVMRATTVAANLLGGRVVEIDGKPIDEVMRRLETIRGGTPQWRRYYAAHYMYFSGILYGLDVAPDENASTWTVVSPGGATVTRTLQSYAASPTEGFAFPQRWYSAEPLEGLSAGWQSFQPDQKLPLSLADFDNTFQRVRFPDSCVMYLQYKSNDDDGKQSIRAFTAQAAADMRAHPPCALIMDLRYDDGGNYLTTAHFMRKLPDYVAPGGHIYLLTGNTTFSAGIVSAAFIKQAGGDRVTILGEQIGDRLQFLSEGRRGCLPNFPVCVSYATGKHDYQHRCTDLNVCFWLNYLYPTRIRSLDPNETIPLSFSQWREGRDPPFARAWALATAQQ
jgi:hypothetical protein